MGLIIDRDRLWSDLMAVGQIGFVEGKGVTRPAPSDADIEAKDCPNAEKIRDGY